MFKCFHRQDIIVIKIVPTNQKRFYICFNIYLAKLVFKSFNKFNIIFYRSFYYKVTKKVKLWRKNLKFFKKFKNRSSVSSFFLNMFVSLLCAVYKCGYKYVLVWRKTKVNDSFEINNLLSILKPYKKDYCLLK